MIKKIIISLFTLVFALFFVKQTAMAVNLVVNGDFEVPSVSNAAKWDIYPSGTSGLGWNVDWVSDFSPYQSVDRPEPANLELHQGVLGNAQSGVQYAELDTDWKGPDNPLNGEPASVVISQSVETCRYGGDYTLSFYWKPRPDHSNNQIEVLWNGVVAQTLKDTDFTGSDWQLFTTTVTALVAGSSTLSFREIGTPDSLGMFVDNVSLEQKGDCKDPGCTYSQGYWKNHGNSWPENFSPLGWNKTEWLTILGLPVRGDARLTLLHQLIAAELNIQNGADSSSVAADMTAAEEFFGLYKPGVLPWDGTKKVSPTSQDGQQMVVLAGKLDQFNNGIIGPGHCSDETTVTPTCKPTATPKPTKTPTATPTCTVTPKPNGCGGVNGTNSCTTSVTQVNSINLVNGVVAGAGTGNNSLKYNVGSTSTSTGNARISVKIKNILGLNSANVSGCCGTCSGTSCATPTPTCCQ